MVQPDWLSDIFRWDILLETKLDFSRRLTDTQSNLSKVEAVSWAKVSERLRPTVDLPDLPGGKINVCVCAYVCFLRTENLTSAAHDFMCNYSHTSPALPIFPHLPLTLHSLAYTLSLLSASLFLKFLSALFFYSFVFFLIILSSLSSPFHLLSIPSSFLLSYSILHCPRLLSFSYWGIFVYAVAWLGHVWTLATIQTCVHILTHHTEINLFL